MIPDIALIRHDFVTGLFSKIDTIKRYRNETHAGLLEEKRTVDRWEEEIIRFAEIHKPKSAEEERPFKARRRMIL